MKTTRRTLLFLCCISITLLSTLAPASAPLPPIRAQADQYVYLPLVSKSTACAGMNDQEKEIVTLMTAHPDQQRPSLTCHPILAQVARERAEDMAARGYFGHVNPDGYGPNYLVTQAGYVLPTYYDSSPTGNNIESIAAGYPTASDAWNGWMTSPGHRTHLLGSTPFWAEQIEYGIGYAKGGPYGHYWVVITAKPGP